jgi:hypothetical protein
VLEVSYKGRVALCFYRNPCVCMLGYTVIEWREIRKEKKERVQLLEFDRARKKMSVVCSRWVIIAHLHV